MITYRSFQPTWSLLLLAPFLWVLYIGGQSLSNLWEHAYAVTWLIQGILVLTVLLFLRTLHHD